MILVIHTLRRDGVELALVRAAGTATQSSAWRLVRQLRQPVTQARTEVLTPAVDRLLKQAKVKSARKRLSDLTGIVVATGPGGFSAVRSGVVVANALGLALGIPVTGVEGEFADLQALLASDRFSRALKRLGASHHSSRTLKPTFARPSYGAEPHITKAQPKKVQQHKLKS